MYMDYYGGFSFIFVSFFIWWIALFVFQRIMFRSLLISWKRDIIVTLFQSIFVVVSLPILFYFIKP